MNPSRLFRNFVFLFSLVGLGSIAWGEIFYFKTSDTNNSQLISNILVVESNTTLVADFLAYSNETGDNNFGGNIYFEMQVGSNEWLPLFHNKGFNSSDKLTIRGPKSLRYRGTSLYSSYNYYWAAMLLQYEIKQEEQVPSKKFATVIPENASTNIRVVLEQSTDLINWTTAAPGVFPPSTAKRFFRVRSEEE